MQTKQKTNTAQLIFAILMVISGCIGIFLSAKTSGIGLFIMYTEDSNLFNLLVAIIYLASFFMKSLKNPTAKKVIKQLRYITTCCVTLTFLVVLFILSPMLAMETGSAEGFLIMFFKGSMLFNHFLTPILAFISFVFLEKEPTLKKKNCFYAIIPTFIYAAVTITLNALRLLDGPYPFLRVHNQSILASIIWVIAIFALNYLIAWLLLFFNTKVAEKVLRK